ncbi:V-set and immunoglobulin domain-containing protein 10 [Pelodytes ibericus]
MNSSLVALTGEVNESIVIPCHSLKDNTTGTAWFKNSITQPLLDCDSNSSLDARLQRVNGSSLKISSLQIQDEGNYTCHGCLESTDEEYLTQLLISSGPQNLSASIYPTITLQNGTLYTFRGSNLIFNCSCWSYPEPKMEWTLSTFHHKPELFHQAYGYSVNFSLYHLASNLQGNYSCSAENPVSGLKANSTLQLLVYYPPLSPIYCYANNSEGLFQLVLVCTWRDGYPSPELQWKQNGETLLNQTSVRNDADTLVISLNRSQLSVGQQFSCHGNHLIIDDRKKNKCELQIDLPVLQTQPLRTCLLGANVTLSCSVSGANPPAVISWLRNQSNPDVEIQASKKYDIFQRGSTSYLTISNCSNDGDGGYYVCKAENALGIKEINVWLTINKPHNIAGIVLALLLLFLLVVALITGIILYCDPQVYLKAHFFRSSGPEVMVLVDEEDGEEMEEVEELTNQTSYTNTATTDHSVANGNIYKHQVLFHHPPDKISPALASDIIDDTSEIVGDTEGDDNPSKEFL